MDLIPSPNTENGKYQDYDPITRQKGTRVTAEMLLNTQLEIVNAIVAMGKVPDGNNLEQLGEVLLTLANKDLDSLSEKGIKYIKQLSAFIPPSVVLPSPASTLDGFLICNGAAVSRATYDLLFDAIGTMYGSGNGSTTFNIPDMRGRFPRGFQSGLTNAIGTPQAGGIPNITATLMFGTATGVGPNTQYEGSFYNAGGSYGSGVTGASGGGSKLGFTASNSSSLYGAGTEVRPINHAFNFFIKY